MKFKDLLLPFCLALGTTWMLQYFFSDRQASVLDATAQSGQRFTAPANTQIEVHKPLNLEIDFLDTKNPAKAQIIGIDTDHARYEFSNEGASLNRLEFKRNWAGKEGYLATIFPPSTIDKEKRSFLIAFDEKTPYYFELLNKTEEADKITLSYKGSNDDCVLIKKFIIFKHIYRMDLEIIIEPESEFQGSLRPRVFFGSPLISELAGEDTITGIVNDARNNIKILAKNDDTIHSYWANPTLFGSQDRYFAHALVSDNEKFTQRAYYKAVNLDNLYSVLEGPAIKSKSHWHLSFYLGPKEDGAMAEVDNRLEQTLNYGLFAFISKPLSKLMLHMLNFIYSYVKNYGWAIILLTILIKLFLLPFTFKGEQGLKKSVEFQKKLDHLQHKYKNDKEALAQARAELIRKHGISGMGGCLPLLMQLPVFWALSIVLSNAIQLYKAPFLWIPDLTMRDPYYVLPACTVIAMILHSPTNDPKQRISSLAMAFVIGGVVSSLSGGLALFMLVSTILGVIQAFVVRKLKL